MRDATQLVARLLTSVIFVTSACAKVIAWDSNIAYIATRHLPMKPVLLAIALVIELAGGLCLIAGFETRIAAWIMAAYLVIVTVLFHTFASTHYQKNLGIIGALLMLAACGAGRWSVDARRTR